MSAIPASPASPAAAAAAAAAAVARRSVSYGEARLVARLAALAESLALPAALPLPEGWSVREGCAVGPDGAYSLPRQGALPPSGEWPVIWTLEGVQAGATSITPVARFDHSGGRGRAPTPIVPERLRCPVPLGGVVRALGSLRGSQPAGCDCNYGESAPTLSLADEGNTLVVTQHSALVALLRERGLIPAGDVRVVAHVSDPSEVEGKHIVGVLPLHLAALAATVTSVLVTVPPELRGVKDIPLDVLRGLAGPAVTYTVAAQ